MWGPLSSHTDNKKIFSSRSTLQEFFNTDLKKMLEKSLDTNQMVITSLGKLVQ